MGDFQSYDQLYPGRFLRAGQFLGKPVTLTIKDVMHETLEGDKGKEQKTIMTFQEKNAAIVLCKLNAICIKAMFGSSIPAWVGKKVMFYPTDTLMPMPSAKGEDRICIRVYGSPDIASDMTAEFKPPRRKSLMIPLKCTKKAQQQGSTNQASPMAATQQTPMVRTEPQPQETVKAVNGPANVCQKCNAVSELLAEGKCEKCFGAEGSASGEAF
jgi:ribosomal protein L40E